MEKDIKDSKNSMEDSLKAFVVSKIKSIGFSGTFPHFRRENDRLEFVSFQFNRNGGSFVLECGFIKRDDLISSFKDLPLSKLNYGNTRHENRIRIKPDNFKDQDYWFDYSKFKDVSEFENLSKEILILIPKVEIFFTSKVL